MKYFFGAAFDPITNAHCEIIKNLADRCGKGDTLYITITCDDEKNFTTSAVDRFEMVDAALKSMQIENYKINFQSCRTYEYIQKNFGTEKELRIVIGEDEWDALQAKKWANSDKLLEEYKFIVFTRNQKMYRTHPVRYSYEMVEIHYNNISSSKCREILYSNPMCKFGDVMQYIKRPVYDIIIERCLYHQNPINYEALEGQFVKEYREKMKERGYAEPSVTVDILAHNSKGQILLIRRGNYPYKNFWCLPGGFFDCTDADLNYAAAREFAEETTIKIPAKEYHQIKTYGHKFDPRMRIIDVAFEVFVDDDKVNDALGSDDAVDARWFDYENLPVLGFHHKQIVDDFVNKLALSKNRICIE